MNYDEQERAKIRAGVSGFLARTGIAHPSRGITSTALRLIEDLDELSRKLAIEKVEIKEYEKRVAKTVDGLRGRINEERRFNSAARRLVEQQRETIRVLRKELAQAQGADKPAREQPRIWIWFDVPQHD